MKVDIEDVLFWMDAVRNSKDRYRTLESFWKGQVYSKLWLVERLEQFAQTTPNRIVIHGGWNGVLAALLFNSNIAIEHITSVDIDPACEETANIVNKRYEMEGRFSAVTADMCLYKYDADIVINTSCEHLTQEQYNRWLENVPNKKTLIVLQSNNYFNCTEHIRCSPDLDNFEQKSKLDLILSDELELLKYTRFMLIGKNNV